jgi:hypothetical protein
MGPDVMFRLVPIAKTLVKRDPAAGLGDEFEEL